MFSAAKAIVAVAILIAIDESRLSLDDPITKFFKDSLPENYSERFDRMTVYDLLTMHTGHANGPFAMMIKAGGDRARSFFRYAPEFEPGTHFMYNNGVPDMLGLILYNLTGMRVLEYLEDRLFKPLSMDGMNAERYGDLDELPTVTCSTRALLKLAYLLKNHGRWNGQQIISEKLADMAGSYLVPSLRDPEPLLGAYDTKFGYGFQIWHNSVGGFRIDGGRGQFGIVIPDSDLVIAINATEADQQVLPLLVWKHITNRLFAVPIAGNPQSYKALTEKLSSLTWAENGDTDLSPDVWGDYALSEDFSGTKNISVTVDTRGNVTLKTDLLSSPVSCGKLNSGEWSVIPEPFKFEVHHFGSGIGKDNVTATLERLAVPTKTETGKILPWMSVRPMVWTGSSVTRSGTPRKTTFFRRTMRRF